MGYPVLSDDFFKNGLTSVEVFERHRSKGDWSANFFPISEWEGLLFVAVSPGHSGMRIGGNWCLVQANSELMLNLYRLWTATPLELKDLTAIAGSLHAQNLNPLSDDASAEQIESPKTEMLDLMLATQIKPISIDKIELLKSTPPATPEPDHEWMALWKELLGKYQHGMILTSQNGMIQSWKWDHLLSCSSEPGQYSVQVPSPFRICTRTQKSYHGKVSKSEVMDQFFKEWNQNQYPDCLSLCPISAGEVVVGFLMAWGPETSNTESALKILEEYSEKLGPILYQVIHQKKKTA